MIFDSHIHTEFSSDSTMKIEDAIQRAKDLNLGLTLTEHIDLIYPDTKEFKLDIPNYFNSYDKYRGDSLLLGVELGLSTSVLKENKEIASSYPFDYIIGSMHAVNDEDIFLSYSKKMLTKQDYYSIYLNNTIDNIKNYTDFDALGHLDYPCRYCNYDDNELYYSDHSDLIDEVIKTLLINDKVLELNVRRIANNKSYTALLDIYKRYAQLGGKYITLGSDAHTTENIGYKFNDALAFLNSCNLKGIYYKNRKPELF